MLTESLLSIEQKSGSLLCLGQKECIDQTHQVTPYSLMLTLAYLHYYTPERLQNKRFFFTNTSKYSGFMAWKPGPCYSVYFPQCTSSLTHESITNGKFIEESNQKIVLKSLVDCVAKKFIIG